MTIFTPIIGRNFNSIIQSLQIKSICLKNKNRIFGCLQNFEIKNLHINFICKRLLSSHTERTANNFRQKEKIAVRVSNTSRLSPTVKALKFRAESPVLFKAGQWIDLFIPLETTVGGYSICSAPFESVGNNEFQIAVKYVPDSPAQWCHDAAINEKAHIRIGGDFYFEPDQDFSTEHFVFVAGGVGINPLHSVIKQTLYVDNFVTKLKRPSYRLLFCAKNELELLFKYDFMEFNSLYPNFVPSFFVSKEPPYSDNPLIKSGHVTKKDLVEAMASKEHSKTKVFVCGPPPMIDFVVNTLKELKLPTDRLFYEKWW